MNIKNPLGFISNKFIFLLYVIIVLGFIGIYTGFKTNKVSAYVPLATNTFPNPAASTPYPLYMTIGSGEFDVPIAAAAIVVDSPGTYNLSIDEARFCNVDSFYSNQALDLPRSVDASVPYFSTLF
nr:hypothetical protein [bacterium]